MKTIQNKLSVIAALLLLMLVSSCSKYINLKPEDATYDEVFWKSGANVDKALAGAYGSFRSALRQDAGYFIFGSVPSAEFVFSGNFWNYQDIAYNGNFDFGYAPYLEGTVWNWTRFYAVVNQCHLIVENTPGIDESLFEGGADQKNQSLGEAYFLRAYTYFYMTRIWGDPVVTKESLKDPSNVQPIARTPEAEALDYCIEDLLKAVDLLQPASQLEAPTKASKGAAQALLAQIYGWKHDYANAGKYAQDLISSGEYALVSGDHFGDIFKGSNSESIFEIFMKHDDANKEGAADFFGNFLHSPLIKDKDPYYAWTPNLELFAPIYDTTNDLRFKQTFGDYDGDPYLKKYANVNYYDPTQKSVYVVDNNLVMIRLADVLLLRAEAAYKTGDEGTALLYLNQVKARAGLEPVTISGEDIMEELMFERYRELYGEGVLAYDLIRMDKLKDWFPDQYSADRLAKKGYYWPLDMRTLLPQNILLTQNEWWKNH
ncbi:MAG: RagB/SusD family nutrient uptake outer membrane protein [Bacteroidetes bacterium]|nr:RagB/SusD family nutrient uptake outer membrane protein [Bacteroidota bacterium]